MKERKDILTPRQKRIIFACLFFLVAVYLPFVWHRYSSFVKDTEKAGIKKELDICMAWQSNLDTLKQSCLADEMKSSFSGYSAYAKKAEFCRAELKSMKEKFIRRSISDFSAGRLYVAAEMLESPDYKEEKRVFFSFLKKEEPATEAGRIKKFLNSRSTEEKNALRLLMSCRKNITGFEK